MFFFKNLKVYIVILLISINIILFMKGRMIISIKKLIVIFIGSFIMNIFICGIVFESIVKIMFIISMFIKIGKFILIFIKKSFEKNFKKFKVVFFFIFLYLIGISL